MPCQLGEGVTPCGPLPNSPTLHSWGLMHGGFFCLADFVLEREGKSRTRIVCLENSSSAVERKARSRRMVQDPIINEITEYFLDELFFAQFLPLGALILAQACYAGPSCARRSFATAPSSKVKRDVRRRSVALGAR